MPKTFPIFPPPPVDHHQEPSQNLTPRGSLSRGYLSQGRHLVRYSERKRGKPSSLQSFSTSFPR